jgi:predicted small metal-binding protein
MRAMFVLSCKDLGLTDCEFVVEADNPRKLKDRMFAHARDEHPELIAGITDERHRELEQKMQELMTVSAT